MLVTDNWIFRINYKITTCVLFVSSIMVFTNQGLFTKPIHCIWRSSWHDIDLDFLNNFCLIHPTFSQQEDWDKAVGEEIPYPGIGKYDKSKTLVYHSYYPWVAVVLLMQAILFYIPRYVWKINEAGRMESVVSEIRLCKDVDDFQKNSLKWTTLIAFKQNGWYHFSYFFAEILNLVNVFGQIFLTDVFLGGAFLNYGRETVQFTDWKWTPSNNPMTRVFPRMAECILHRYGSSGEVQRYKTSCLLPLNVLNEKIYIFLWFWFMSLAIVYCLAFIHRALTIVIPNYHFAILRITASSSDYGDLRTLRRMCRSGDMFFIRRVVSNLDSARSKHFVSFLAKGFRTCYEESPRNKKSSFEFEDMLKDGL